jgi:hypothetical protein
MSKMIEVTISAQGEARIETKGFIGDSCREATKSLEQALGLRQAEQLTAEFHLAATQPQQQSQTD